MNIIDFLKENKIEVIIVLALFSLAFGIRTIPSDKFPGIYGFDSFYSAREAKYLVTKGYVWPTNDSVTDYPFNRKDIYPGDFGWVGFDVLIYKIVGAFVGVNGFDYGLYGIVSAWLVAIVGAMAIPAVYIFGKYAYNRWVGLSSALLLVASSGHIFYSIFGHAENDALGFTLFFLVLFSFIATVKRRSWKFGLLTTVLLTWLSMVWQTYIVAALLMGGTVLSYFASYSILNSFGYYKNSPERDKTRKWMVYGLLFGIPSIIRYDILFTTGNIRGYTPIGIFCFAGAALVASLIEIYIKKVKPSKETFQENAYVKALSISLIVIMLGLIAFQGKIITDPLSFIGINLGTGVERPDYEARLLTTIAEQNPIEGANFLERLSSLSLRGFGNAVWFALFGVLLIFGKIFIMPFVRKDFTYEWDILALGFILFSMWILTEKAITIFFLSAAIAFGAGYFLATIISIIKFGEKYLSKYKIHLFVGVSSFILILSFSYISTGVPVANSYGYDIPQEWFQTFEWLNTQAPPNTVVTAWWDYGHWINYWAGDNKSHPVYTNLDNIQDRADMIYTVASSFTHTTPCTQDPNTGKINCESSQEALELAEKESLSILKPLSTTHILIDKEIVLGKFNALMRIANTYLGYFQAFGCGESTRQPGNATFIVCDVGQIKYQGELKTVGFVFTKDQWSTLVSTPWPGTVTNLPLYLEGTNIMVGQVNTRWFAKNENFSGKTLYGSAVPHEKGFFGGGATPNAPIVFSFEHRLFFHDPSLKHVKLVYDNGWNAIYEVNFSGIPNEENFTDWTTSRSVVCKGKFENASGCKAG